MKVTKSEILNCDWTAPQLSGREALTQAIARAAFEHLVEGLIGGEYVTGELKDVAALPYQTDELELAGRLISNVADESPDVIALCENYRLRREELGRLTGFSLRALAEWSAGKLPSQPAKRRLHEVRRLLDALAEIVQPESIPKWLHQPNPAFGRLTPLQVIELGEIDRLWAMVHDMGSGQPE